MPAGFEDHTADVPFASGTAVAGVVTRVIPDTKSHDLILSYADHAGVLYKDRLGGKYEAQALDAVPAGAVGLVAADLNNDSTPDLVWTTGAALNEGGKYRAVALDPKGRFALADVATASGDVADTWRMSGTVVAASEW